MKKLILFLIAISSPLFAAELTTFKEITNHLENGREITVVVHDKLCSMNDPNNPKIPLSTMFMKPASVIFTETLLGFDGVKFSPAKYYPSFPNGILQRASFVLRENGQVSILIAFFNIETNFKSPSVQDVNIQCQLGEGVKVFKA